MTLVKWKLFGTTLPRREIVNREYQLFARQPCKGPGPL